MLSLMNEIEYLGSSSFVLKSDITGPISEINDIEKDDIINLLILKNILRYVVLLQIIHVSE